MVEHKDIRSVRTEQALVNAMFHLLSKNDFSQITVNDICNEASLSRTTFYMHFDDKYSLVVRCIEDIIKNAPITQGAESQRDFTEMMLKEVYKNREALKNLLTFTGTKELEQKMQKLFVETYEEYYKSRPDLKGRLDVPLKIAAVYNSAGVAAIIKWWIMDDCKAGVNEMMSYITRLHVNRLKT